MDPLRIVVRIAFIYVILLVLTRISGHRTVKQNDVPSFILAIVIGDMSDDLFWSEVPASQFVVAVCTLFLVHLRHSMHVFHAGHRNWRRGVDHA